jgi:hypothetical protein
MSIELGWTVASQAATWAQQAVKAARNRKQQRAAHVVANAGVLVAGMRALDRRFRRLFVPLLYFEPSAWPEERRSRWADELALLAYDDTILPRMRTSLAALKQNISEQPEELRRPLQRLVDDICGGFIVGKSQAGPTMEDLERGTAGWDSILPIEAHMPQIVELVRSADEGSVRDQVKWLAAAALKRPDKFSIKWEFSIPAWLLEEFGDADRFGPLRPLSDAAEFCFGEILAFQQKVFPALPSPDWVWSDE